MKAKEQKIVFLSTREIKIKKKKLKINNQTKTFTFIYLQLQTTFIPQIIWHLFKAMVLMLLQSPCSFSLRSQADFFFSSTFFFFFFFLILALSISREILISHLSRPAVKACCSRFYLCLIPTWRCSDWVSKSVA